MLIESVRWGDEEADIKRKLQTRLQIGWVLLVHTRTLNIVIKAAITLSTSRVKFLPRGSNLSWCEALIPTLDSQVFNNSHETPATKSTHRIRPIHPQVGVAKKHQHWKFQDVTKNCGRASPGNHRTPWGWSYTSKMTLCIAFQFLAACSKKNGSKQSKKCNFSNLAHYSSKNGKRITQM